MNDATPNVWTFLIAVVTLLGVIATPLLNLFLTRKQTEKITSNAVNAAKEVKADLAVAKVELQHDAAVRSAKLAEVHEIASKTEILVNGDRAAKEQRIRSLEAQLREKGHEPA